MSQSLPCPGCSTMLPPEATACPICMRPRTKQEIVRGYTQLKADEARRKKRPFQIAAAVLVVAGGGWLGWTFRAGIGAAASSAKAKTAAWYDRFTDPKFYSPTGTGGLPPAPVVNSAPPAAPLSPSGALAQTRDPAPAPSAAPSAATQSNAEPPRESPKAPPAKNAWRVSGLVYDLANLEPVPGAVVAFSREGGPTVTATTDKDGQYEADIAKGDGWTVYLRPLGGQKARVAGFGEGWRQGQIVDLDPPYKQRDEDERRAALEHVSDGDLAPAAVGWKKSQSRVALDLVAVPLSGMPR